MEPHHHHPTGPEEKHLDFFVFCFSALLADNEQKKKFQQEKVKMEIIDPGHWANFFLLRWGGNKKEANCHCHPASLPRKGKLII